MLKTIDESANFCTKSCSVHCMLGVVVTWPWPSFEFKVIMNCMQSFMKGFIMFLPNNHQIKSSLKFAGANIYNEQ